MAEQSTIQVSEKIKIITPIPMAITIAISLITFGASLYTFFKSLPRLEAVEKTTMQLQIKNQYYDDSIEQLKKDFEWLRNVETNKE